MDLVQDEDRLVVSIVCGAGEFQHDRDLGQAEQAALLGRCQAWPPFVAVPELRPDPSGR